MDESKAVNKCEADAGSVATGWQVIREFVKTLDHSPGVYRMLGTKDEVLYVGKARSLRNRVANYAKATGHNARIASMISNTARMMVITTRTETEALLLEQNLIKQLKPRYNILLRDDKSFPDIRIRTDHEYPQIVKHRGARKAPGRYFGPFASGSAVSRTLQHLERAFLLRNCSDSYFANRSRPCLQYQIKRCSAPCVGKISPEAYRKQVQEAELFLEGKSTEIQARLAEQMNAASSEMNYEKAAALRDRIRALTSVQGSQNVNPEKLEEADVIALAQEGGEACIQIFFIRAHQNWGNYAYYPRVGPEDTAADILEAFIAQFYATKPASARVLVSDKPSDMDLLENMLSEKLGKRARIQVPQRGENLMLMGEALRNAREALARRQAETKSRDNLLAGLTEAFELKSTPERIEIYDNSHIQGAHAVGAMVVHGREGWLKSHYRKFNIKSDALTPGDDFAMMDEVLTRRFTRLMREDPERTSGNWPDLLLIDGGAGQMGRVYNVLRSLDVKGVEVIGVAKGEDRDAGKEEFYRFKKPVKALGKNDPVLHFIQRLRDEAHRFAIGTHRAKRSAAISKTPLDEVPGVGATRKRALLLHFGSAKAVSNASPEDLRAVKGISAQLAESIFDFFHPSG